MCGAYSTHWELGLSSVWHPKTHFQDLPGSFETSRRDPADFGCRDASKLALPTNCYCRCQPFFTVIMCVLCYNVYEWCTEFFTFFFVFLFRFLCFLQSRLTKITHNFYFFFLILFSFFVCCFTPSKIKLMSDSTSNQIFLFRNRSDRFSSSSFYLNFNWFSLFLQIFCYFAFNLFFFFFFLHSLWLIWFSERFVTNWPPEREKWFFLT